MYRVSIFFKNGRQRVRYAKTRTMAQLIALNELKKREINYFSIDRDTDTI